MVDVNVKYDEYAAFPTMMYKFKPEKRLLLHTEMATYIKVQKCDENEVVQTSSDLYKLSTFRDLADVAKKDGCYYLYQCGDDVQFLNKDWVEKSVNALKAHDNIGLSGPIDYGRLVMGGDVCKPGGERFIMTQSFVSIKHLEMFGSFFFLIACFVFLIPFFKKDKNE